MFPFRHVAQGHPIFFLWDISLIFTCTYKTLIMESPSLPTVQQLCDIVFPLLFVKNFGRVCPFHPLQFQNRCYVPAFRDSLIEIRFLEKSLSLALLETYQFLVFFLIIDPFIYTCTCNGVYEADVVI